MQFPHAATLSLYTLVVTGQLIKMVPHKIGKFAVTMTAKDNYPKNQSYLDSFEEMMMKVKIKEFSMKFCGQSYKHSVIVNFDSRVVLTENF